MWRELPKGRELVPGAASINPARAEPWLSWPLTITEDISESIKPVFFVVPYFSVLEAARRTLTKHEVLSVLILLGQSHKEAKLFLGQGDMVMLPCVPPHTLTHHSVTVLPFHTPQCPEWLHFRAKQVQGQALLFI